MRRFVIMLSDTHYFKIIDKSICGYKGHRLNYFWEAIGNRVYENLDLFDGVDIYKNKIVRLLQTGELPTRKMIVESCNKKIFKEIILFEVLYSHNNKVIFRFYGNFYKALNLINNNYKIWQSKFNPDGKHSITKMVEY